MEICNQTRPDIAHCRVPTLKKGLITALFSKLFQCWRIRRERQMLLGLDERMLKDIGLSRADAEREGARASWDCKRTERSLQ